MSAPPIGLLVIHGIGNQRAGDLCREIAALLADDARADAPEPCDSGASSGADRRGQSTAHCSLEPVTVGEVPVLVAEANWSALSSPDNPPVVRPAIPIVRDFFETIRAAWRQSRLASILRRLDRRKFPIGSSTILIVTALLLTSLVAWAHFMEGTDPPRVLTVPTLTIWLGMTIHLTVRSVRYRWLRFRRAPGWQRFAEAFLWGAVSYFLGMVVVLSIYFVAVVLLCFAVAVFVACLVAVAGAAVAKAVRGIATLMLYQRAASVRCWTHRLGWVMVVLPVHAMLESVRAAGNLISVMFTERAWAPRLTAFGGLACVFVGFVLLLVVCEILLLPVLLVPVILSECSLTVGEAFAFAMAVSVIILPFYLLGIRLALPAIDLLLDVANYHLASEAERRSYHEIAERAVVALLEAGCKEIHILAHSLGTVLVYDWLRTTRPGTYPIAVLHTIGSPLGWFWYVDHGVLRRRVDRHGLRAHVSRAWTNHWALADPVSSALDHYDGTGLAVANERLQSLGPLLLCHVRYWKNQTVLGAVRREIAATAAYPSEWNSITTSSAA